MRTFMLSVFFLFISLCSVFAQFVPIINELNGAAGVEVDADGNVWVTETGSGVNNAQVLFVDTNGNKSVAIAGLPSAVDSASGDIVGPWRSIQLPPNRLAVIMGEGPNPPYGSILLFNMDNFVPGVSPAKTIADTTSSIEISSFAVAQPGVTNSNPYSAVLDTDGTWYVADAGANMIIKITPSGERSVFARFDRIPNPTPIGPPVIDPVPTRIIANPDGGFFVSTLTGFPFLQGLASVYQLDRNGKLSVYAKGLTMLTDLAFDHKTGDIYAMQFGNFAFDPQPGFVFGSGKIHRIQRGGLFTEVVASNFGPGASLALSDNGDIYATSLFTGQLLKLASPDCSDVSLAIEASQTQLSLYRPISYTVTVTNNSSATANNVRVFWLPAYKRFREDNQPFAYQSSTVSAGNLDWWRGYWTISSLAPGESATATYNLFVVNDALDVTQSAEVAACNQATGFAGDNSVKAILTTKGNSASKGLIISQNPAHTNTTFNIENESDSKWTLQLVNTVGQVVFQHHGQYSEMLNVDLTDFENGMYLVHYQMDGVRNTEKLIIQH